jgi:hypothetical protein
MNQNMNKHGQIFIVSKMQKDHNIQNRNFLIGSPKHKTQQETDPSHLHRPTAQPDSRD